MTRRPTRYLHLASLILIALVSLSPMSASQGIMEVDVDAATLNWKRVSIDGTAFANFKVAEKSYFAISQDGGNSIVTIRQQKSDLKLHFKTFDPLVKLPKIPESLQADFKSRLFLVQYHTQGLEQYRQVLREFGVEVLQVFPWQANLVRMDADLVSIIEELDFVRWVGNYEPAYRTDVYTRGALLDNTLQTKRYHIHVTKKGPEEKAQISQFVSAIGGQIEGHVSPHGFLIDATLTPAQVFQVLRRDDVLFMDPWSAPETDLDIARELGGADAIELAEGYSGQGVRGKVQDGGLETSHPDFQSTTPIIHVGNSTNTSHGTSVYGIVFGDGMTNAAARGFIPDAQPIFQSYSASVDRYVETGELTQNPLRCVFETNSWGNTRTFFYTTISADMDNILFDHDVVVLQSQSNAGNQDSRPQAWAKNIFSVGGIRHQNTLDINDDTWGSGGSIGPADDGRIKPDISAFYDSTLAANSSGGHSNFGGTSGATPITAGHMGLVHQMWADGIFGNSLVNWDVWDNRPHATTAKALLINSATQYAFSGLADDLTRVHQGWGRPSVDVLYNRRDKMQVIDQNVILAPLATHTENYNVSAGVAQLRVTMIFSDPPGNPAAAVARINDLTLKVTDPLGTVYFGNNGLLANNFSTSGGVSNTIDTVEQVLLQNPIVGNWIVEVIASEINQDGHVETGSLDADFSLVVSGIDPAPAPAADLGQANRSGGSLQIFNAVNLNGEKPKQGVNGPFYANIDNGGDLKFIFEGNVNKDFQLFLGPLGVGNESFGTVGTLDVGLIGPGAYSDIQLIMDGVSPVSFLDLSANTGPTGRKEMSFSLPPFIVGTIGTFQAAIWDSNVNNIRITAATQVTVN
ncbi:MAG: serine protease AprX [Planctomycetota bacterium]|jgi:serine protease AprX